MEVASAEPKPGAIARIRQRTYLVEEVRKPKTSRRLDACSCVDDDNQGQPLDVLWEKELNPKILKGEAWGSIASKRL